MEYKRGIPNDKTKRSLLNKAVNNLQEKIRNVLEFLEPCHVCERIPTFMSKRKGKSELFLSCFVYTASNVIFAPIKSF